MHILYVHQNFPAQFGHVARHLVRKPGWRCTFISETPGGMAEGVEKIQYKIAGGARETTHFCSRTFENAIWHADSVMRTLLAAVRSHPEFRPDLIVGHSGFGSTLFLPELFPNTPIINLFEHYYQPHDPESDMDFRRDLGWKQPLERYARCRSRNAMILLDLQNCDAGYTPTKFQQSRFPAEYQPKLRTIFDGIDRHVYHGHEESLRPALGHRHLRNIAGVEIPPDSRVVTYVSRGFESMRGFDIFMRAAKLIYQQFPDVLFLVIGTDRIAYGGDDLHLGGFTSFKDWTLAQQTYDLSKFRFIGRLAPPELARALAATDLHIYLTVPFVLSWSMMDAMSCGAVVLGSATSPVKEMIVEGENGLLADFFNVEELAGKALNVLRDPAAFRPLGRAAEKLIAERYSLEAVMPEMIAMYNEVASSRRAMPRVPEADLSEEDPQSTPIESEPTAGGRAPVKSPFLG